MTRRRAHNHERFDVICDCGWQQLRCPESEIPRHCPGCGGAIIEEGSEKNPEASDRSEIIREGERLFADQGPMDVEVAGELVARSVGSTDLDHVIDVLREHFGGDQFRRNSEKRRFIGWGDPGFSKCEGCGEIMTSKSATPSVCAACLATGVLPSSPKERWALQSMLNEAGLNAVLGSKEAGAFFASRTARAAEGRALGRARTSETKRAKREEGRRRLSKGPEYLALAVGTVSGKYKLAMPCLSCGGDATSDIGTCPSCTALFTVWLREKADEGFSPNPQTFHTFTSSLPKCEGCGRPTANRSGLCSACGSLGHRGNPRSRPAAGNPHKTCPRCGSGVKDVANECWKCGLTFDTGAGKSVFGRVARGALGAARNTQAKACVDCGKPTVPGTQLCSACIERTARAWDRERECQLCGERVQPCRCIRGIKRHIKRSGKPESNVPRLQDAKGGAKLLVRYVYDKTAADAVDKAMDELDPDDPAWEAALEAFADDMGGTFDIRAEVEAVLKKIKVFTGPPQVGGDPETALELCYTIRGLTEAKRLAALLRKEFAGRRNIQFAAVERCEDSPFQVRFHER